MTIKKSLCILVLMMSTATTFAESKFQAGDIEAGMKWQLSEEHNTASYYTHGTSGTITFNCELTGDQIREDQPLIASIIGGKNLRNEYNQLIIINKGANGPYTYTLTDNHFPIGNIKVTYLTGSNVKVRCVGKKS